MKYIGVEDKNKPYSNYNIGLEDKNPPVSMQRIAVNTDSELVAETLRIPCLSGQMACIEQNLWRRTFASTQKKDHSKYHCFAGCRPDSGTTCWIVPGNYRMNHNLPVVSLRTDSRY